MIRKRECIAFIDMIIFFYYLLLKWQWYWSVLPKSSKLSLRSLWVFWCTTVIKITQFSIRLISNRHKKSRGQQFSCGKVDFKMSTFSVDTLRQPIFTNQHKERHRSRDFYTQWKWAFRQTLCTKAWFKLKGILNNVSFQMILIRNYKEKNLSERKM